MKESTALQPLSISMGDYLKAIWELAGDGAASTTHIAGRLGVRPASVTNMLGRLRKMGLVDYEAYYGASLTESGRREVLRLVRRHRLIETFLLEHLGYPLIDLHEEAERLEHVVSDGFTERLARLLGHPNHDPHGDPIPAPDGTLEEEEERPLSESEPESRVRVSRVEDRDNSALSYLADRGLIPGNLLLIKEVRALDGVVTVEDEEGTSHALGHSLASSIFATSIA